MYKIILIALMATLALADIGKVTVVKGDASVERDVKIIKAQNNMGLLKQDIVETAQGRLQMHFKDNTVISLGRESRFVIKEYFYEEGSEEVAALFSIEKGFIKTITGAIGKVMPELFVLETSTTKITPHGTIWSVEVKNKKEIFSVQEGRITLEFNDGRDQKIDLIAGEALTLKKTSDGKVESFKKGKMSNKSYSNTKYENSVEKYGATIAEDSFYQEGIIVREDGSMVNDEGEEVHDNRDGLKNPKKH